MLVVVAVLGAVGLVEAVLVVALVVEGEVAQSLGWARVGDRLGTNLCGNGSVIQL